MAKRGPINNFPFARDGAAPSNVLTGDDQSGSGYFDTGTMRQQWLSSVQVNGASQVINLPAPFVNTDYAVSFIGQNTDMLHIVSKTTSQITVTCFNPSTLAPGVGTFDLVFIGQNA